MTERILSGVFESNAELEAARQRQLVTIETPHLMMREFTPDDVDRIHEISASDGFFYYCFDGTREKAEAFVNGAIDKQNPDPATGKRREILLAVTEKNTDCLIGHVAIERGNHRPGKEDYEVNFFIDPKYQSKGYGREAIANMMRYGFETLKLEDYVVTIHPQNGPSQRVAAREGYVKVGEKTFETTRGVQPRDILVLTKEKFYELHGDDAQPMFMAPLAPKL